MYKSHVIAGRIIEIHADRVLTQQGDMICTYHFRYYMLPEAETWGPDECGLKEESTINSVEQSGTQPPKRSWRTMKPWFLLQKKSANRI